MIEYSPSTAECKNGTSDIHQAKEKYTDECFLDYNKRCAWEEGGTSQWNMKGISQFHGVHPSLYVGHVSHSVLHCKTCAPQSIPQACASNNITPCSRPLCCMLFSSHGIVINNVLPYSPSSSHGIISQSLLSETLTLPHTPPTWQHSLIEGSFFEKSACIL